MIPKTDNPMFKMKETAGDKKDILVSTHRGYEIWQLGPTSYRAAGTLHGSVWSAVCYIDELLSP